MDTAFIHMSFTIVVPQVTAQKRAETSHQAGHQTSILGFHMTSRPPCWCPDPILRELKAFIMLTSFFVFVEKHGC